MTHPFPTLRSSDLLAIAQMTAINSRSVLTPPLPEGAASWTGLRGAASALAIAQLAQQHSRLIVALAANEQHAYQLEAELRFFLGALPLVHLPDSEVDRKSVV